MSYLKIFVVALLVSGLYSAQSQDIGDSSAVNHLAVIWSDADPNFICGGSVVNPHWVLSSASCILDLFKKNQEVLVGAGIRASKQPEQIKKAIKHIIHKLFSPKKSNFRNFALVKVDEVFTKTNLLEISRLPDKGEALCQNPEALAVHQKQGTSRRSWWRVIVDILVFAAKRITKEALKQKMRGEEKIVYSYSTTINNRSVEACENERGGWPLLCAHTIVGVENKCQRAGPRSADVVVSFADVESTLDFIVETIQEKSDKISKGNTEDKGKNKGYSSYLHNNQMVFFAALLLVTCF